MLAHADVRIYQNGLLAFPYCSGHPACSRSPQKKMARLLGWLPGPALSWMANGNQIERLVFAGQGKSLLHLVIMESADGYSSKPQRDGL